jgi:hypothetical protein
MEEKMIAGSQIMEEAKKQQNELMKTKKELEREASGGGAAEEAAGEGEEQDANNAQVQLTAGGDRVHRAETRPAAVGVS